MGQPIVLGQTVVVRKFGIVGVDSGDFPVMIGLYTDSGGEPSQLVAKAEDVRLLNPGRNEWPALPRVAGGSLQLGPGTYWMMAVYGKETVVTQLMSANAVRRSMPYGYASPPASIAPGSTFDYMGTRADYYILVTPP
jgi:hypothetical protein